MTGGGFGRNVELVYEFELKREQDREWFERLWGHLAEDPWPEIREYEARYVPPKRTRRPPSTNDEPELPALADIVEWRDFVEGLRAYDEYYRYYEYDYDVFGETHSWLHTIKTGREVVRLGNWENLTERECFILRGHRARGDEGDWGLLGGVDRGGAAYVFNHRRTMKEVGSIRKKIRKQIQRILNATGNVADVAHAAVQAIGQTRHVEDARSGIGHAAATRWLTFARPDCLVSVNNKSAYGLGEASGRTRRPKELADVYSDFLQNWLYERPWFNEFNERLPDDPFERDLWNCRAALVDVFVYGWYEG